MDVSRKVSVSYLILTICISIGFVCLAVFVFTRSYVRLYESGIDLGTSIWYWFQKMWGNDPSFTATVTQVPDNFYSFSWLIPEFSGYFGVKMGFWWHIMWNGVTFGEYGSALLNGVYVFVQVLMILLLLVIVVVILFRQYFRSTKKEVGHRSLPLRFHMFLLKWVYYPCKDYLVGYFGYCRRMIHGWIWKSWVILWCLNFNFFVIAIEFFSYYFYFICSFDVVNLYIQLYKLIGDLSVVIRFVPIVVWVILVLVFIHHRRYQRAYGRLQHFENMNKGFVGSLGVATLLCGEMGKGKTSSITDMALSLTQYYRHEAFERMYLLDVKFPFYSFSSFEMELKRLISHRYLYSLSSIRSYVRSCKSAFMFCYCNYMDSTSKVDKDYWLNYCSLYSFGFDFTCHPFTVYDGLKEESLFDVLETYGCLFFIYYVESSLIFSNYSIHETNTLIDYGFFPSWSEDFWRLSPKKRNFDDHLSHILDFDMMRLGKTFVSDRDYIGNLEFGVIVISETGKERLNRLGTAEMRISDDDPNQKNDNFNLFVKMYRHSATVDNFCFGKILMDEQRTMSLNADLREVCEDVLFISDKSEDYTVIPFGKFDNWVYEFVDKHFKSFYYKYKTYRGDETLFVYLLKSVCDRISLHHQRLCNIFGFNVLTFKVLNGSSDFDSATSSGGMTHQYYLCHKKIYSDRYVTDAFSDFFFDRSLRSNKGILDVPTYASSRAKSEELLSQHSYVMNDLYFNVFTDYSGNSLDDSGQVHEDENKEGTQ